jgi:hypothetical protein
MTDPAAFRPTPTQRPSHTRRCTSSSIARPRWELELARRFDQDVHGSQGPRTGPYKAPGSIDHTSPTDFYGPCRGSCTQCQH